MDSTRTAGAFQTTLNVGGVAGYARRTLTKKDAFTLRAEFLDDAEGAAGTGAAQTVWETTLTYAYKLNKYMKAKVEYRHDSRAPH